MDLVRIIHVVDTLSSGKCGFNYIYVVGLIQFIVVGLIQFFFLLSLSLWCLSNVCILVGLLSHK